MRHLKMLVGLAAVALMAFVGAGSASAFEQCTVPAVGNMCPEGKKIEKLDQSLVGSMKLQDTSGNTLNTCTAGSMKVTNMNAANGNQTGTHAIVGDIPAGDTTWGAVGTACTFTTDTIKGGTVTATEAAGGGTTVTAASAEWTINTGLFGSCVYTVGAGLDLGSISQGGTTLEINKAVTKISGLCPSSSVWNATWKVTNHTAVYDINN